jgi:hypothetical protein
LLVTVADRFWPVSLGGLLHDMGARGGRTCLTTEADLTRDEKNPACAPVASANDLRSPAAPRDYLRYPASVQGDPTGQFLAFERGQGTAVGSTHDWLADPGVLDPWPSAQIYFWYAGSIPRSSWKSPPPTAMKPGVIVFQYWFFYPYNYYPLGADSRLMPEAPLAGDLSNVDLHQGDWEHVDVLLDRVTHRPLWLYTARHDVEGRFYAWNARTLQFDGTHLRFDGTHPIIQAAFGGHPTYPAGCGGRPRKIAHNLTADWLSCGSGRFAFRGATTPLVDLDKVGWACWGGHFGEARPGFEVDGHNEADGALGVLKNIREFVHVKGPAAPLLNGENKPWACAAGKPTVPENTTLKAH